MRTQDGKRVKGTLAGLSSEELNLARGNKSIRITREDVKRIHLLIKKSPAKKIAIGAAIGLGAFLGGHAASFANEPWPIHPGDPALIALTSGIGAAAGWVWGRRPQKVLVYDAGDPGTVWPLETQVTSFERSRPGKRNNGTSPQPSWSRP